MKAQRIYNIASASVILGLVIYILLMGSPGVNPTSSKIVVRDTLVRVDTFITVDLDTVWRKEFVQLPPQVIPVPDTIYVLQDAPALVNYVDTLRDSTIELSYDAYVEGRLAGIDLNYRLLKPLTTSVFQDTRIERDTTINNYIYPSGFYIGSHVGRSFSQGKNSARISLSVANRKGYMYSYDYDFINKAHSVGVSKKIFGRNVR